MATARPVRHSWVKLRVHVYMCKKCGTAYENKQDRTGGWYRTYFLPDRRQVNASHVPPCEPGPTTSKRIEHYAAAIACYGVGGAKSEETV